MREVFLDISKVFDKVWQEDISGNLLTFLRDFLYCSKQRLVLSEQHASWKNVNARGVFALPGPGP